MTNEQPRTTIKQWNFIPISCHSFLGASHRDAHVDEEPSFQNFRVKIRFLNLIGEIAKDRLLPLPHFSHPPTHTYRSHFPPSPPPLVHLSAVYFQPEHRRGPHRPRDLYGSSRSHPPIQRASGSGSCRRGYFYSQSQSASQLLNGRSAATRTRWTNTERYRSSAALLDLDLKIPCYEFSLLGCLLLRSSWRRRSRRSLSASINGQQTPLVVLLLSSGGKLRTESKEEYVANWTSTTRRSGRRRIPCGMSIVGHNSRSNVFPLSHTEANDYRLGSETLSRELIPLHGPKRTGPLWSNQWVGVYWTQNHWESCCLKFIGWISMRGF